MKKLDSNPAKPVASPTAKSKDDKTDLDADRTTTRSSGMNPVPTSVSEAALKEAHNDLELKVRDRTAQLEATVTALENEMQARNALENQLRQA
jgi:C4-dicarboxylate-specific signal transduction histidine kinase